MSDIGASQFYSAFWDYYIAIISIVSVVGCAVFLWLQGRRTVKAQLDAKGEIMTTGHVWDGDLQEFHNPMPRWWVWLFYITVLFSIVYLILYPGLGTQWKGVLNWTQIGQYQGEVKTADAKFGPIFAAYAAQPIEQVAGDARARQMGERIFLNNCAQCHGSDARGSRGFPNLADGDWLYGGAPAMIAATVTGGRNGVMPPMGAAVGGKADVEDVANHVLSLSDSAHDGVKSARGKSKFDTVCAACHGADAKGNPAIGAPNLTDKIWLYGGSVATISDTVNGGRNNVMPSFKNILTGPEIHLVAAYVWSISNGGARTGAAAPAAGPGK
jgi:cytochrome c oxidase cbb3-type subunit 3